MKAVKCYGRAKFTTVDSSFKKKFFESFDFKNSFGNNSFQEFQQKGSNSSTGVSSTSDYTNIHSLELFASETDSFDISLPTFSPCSSKNVKKKHKSVKHFITSKICPLNKFSIKSASHSSVDLQPVLTSKAKKPLKNKQRISKPFKLPVELTTSYSSRTDLGLSYAKGRSKNAKHLRSYKKGTLKRKRKTNRYSLKKHSSIPIQPSCSDFCENPLSVINTGVKKINKKVCRKKKQLIHKAQDGFAANCYGFDMVPPFDSKHDSFLTAIQPRWSSIYEYSLEIEKVNYSEAIGSKPIAVHDISENTSVSKKSDAIICTNSINGLAFPEIENVKLQHKSDKKALIVSDMCETLSKKLNVNEIVAVNKEKNISKAKVKSIETYKEGIRRKNKDFMSATQTNFTVSKTISEKKNKENECLSETVDQLREYTPAISCKKSHGFYSSTPFASPSTHITVAKFCPSTIPNSPDFQKGVLVTSTPAVSSKTQGNQICNTSRIACLVRQCNSFQNLSFDSFIKLQRCAEISSSVLSRNKIRTSSTFLPFVNGSLYNSQNIHHHTSRSCTSISKTEQLTTAESQCWAKCCSLSNKALHSSVASISAESDFKSTLSYLLKFCGQTRIIPFNELYDWNHATIRKIGEGSYGEVFTLVQNKISSVVKVIPFSEENADHSMQSIESVSSEVTVSQCLSELRNNKSNKTRNFNKLKSVHLVRGYYPDQMLVAWDKFSVARSTYNSRPDIFNDQQMFAIIELEYGGKDMTRFMLRNAAEAESVLKQITISLAIAEEVHLFEHRDLHLGNILVQRNASKTISYVLGGQAFSIPNHGLVVTIIDFTFSRVFHEGCIFYNDLADEDSLFNQTGDYQFQIYKDTKVILNNEWHKCLLYSNVLWLTYLCVKLLEYKYSRPSSKKHEEGLNNIKTFQNNLRSCQNAFECVTTCNIFTSVTKNEQGSTKKMAIKAKLVDRKSTKIHHASYF